MQQILVVDDEVGIRELLSEILHDEGYRVTLAENAGQARAARGQARPDLVLLDIWMPDTDGITLLKEWAAAGQLTMPVVMMSGHGTIDTAVEATKMGAFDFLEKPIALQKRLATVGRALKSGAQQPKPELSLAALGRGAVIAGLRQRLKRLAGLRAPLLLTGEPASGLELRPAFAHRDAVRRFGLERPEVPDPAACQCGAVLQGIKTPPDCKLFGKACTPERPVGACMVSTEGSCAAYYKYQEAREHP